MQTLLPTRYGFRQIFHLIYLGLFCCIFPIGIFITLAVSNHFTFGLPRYDFILLLCLGLQVYMVRSKLESLDELKVITAFHLLGLALELYKTSHGSWSYPEAAYSKVATVPLYSGFMYASVASFICQAWRRFDVRLKGWPRGRIVAVLGLAIYLNFFTHQLFFDFRWILMLTVGILLWKSHLKLSLEPHRYRIPVTFSFVVMGLLIWVAENISTFLGAWQYPDQAGGWQIVGTSKISSWFLLFIISFMAIVELKRSRAKRRMGALENALEGTIV